MAREKDHYMKLGECVRQLWTSGQLADITLCCAECEFDVHSVVLAAYSKTLLAMILEKQSDSKNIRLHVTGVTPPTLHLLLEYFYLGVKPPFNDNIRRAVKVLDIPSLSGLKLSEDKSHEPNLVKAEPGSYDDSENNPINSHQSLEPTLTDRHIYSTDIERPKECIADNQNDQNDQAEGDGTDEHHSLSSPKLADSDDNRYSSDHEFSQCTQETVPYFTSASSTLVGITCTKCGMVFLTKKQLFSHVVSLPDHLDDYVIKKGSGRNRSHQPGMYQCVLCQAEFALKREFIQHFPKLHKDLEKFQREGSKQDGAKEIPLTMEKATPVSQTSHGYGQNTNSTVDRRNNPTNQSRDQMSAMAGLYKLPAKRIRSNQKVGGSTYRHVEKFIACKMENLQRNISDLSLYQCIVCKADFVYKKMACKHVQKCHSDIIRMGHFTDSGYRSNFNTGSSPRMETSAQGTYHPETGPSEWPKSEPQIYDSEKVPAPTACLDLGIGLPGNTSDTKTQRCSSDLTERRRVPETGNVDETSVHPGLYQVYPRQRKMNAAKDFSVHLQLNKYILSKIRNVQRNVSKLPMYLCRVCRSEFQLKAKVYKHIREEHPELYTMKSGTGSAQSTNRSKSAQRREINKNANFKHLEPYINKKGNQIRNKSKEPDYECTVCKESFVYKKDIIRHIIKLHPKIHRAMPNSLKFLCTVCGKLYISSGGLSNHMEVHTSDPVPCHICDKVFKTRLLLNAHLTNMHHLGNSASGYQCEQCGESFITYYNLRYHIQSKHEPKKRCGECGKEFVSKFGLNQHVREKHSRIKTTRFEEASCPHCNKVFFRKNLRAHIRAIHMKDDYSVYKFVCEYCGMRFHKLDKYHRHRKTHEKKLPFSSHTTF